MTLARGEEINSLEDKSVKMQGNAQVFKKKAGETKRNFCFQHYRNILIVALIAAVWRLFPPIMRTILCFWLILPSSCSLNPQVIGVVLYLIFRPSSK
jgi:hypothetical protein